MELKYIDHFDYNSSRKYVRNHYLNNKEYYLLKAKRRNTAIRTEIKKYIWSYLAIHPCVDCGEKDPVVLEFDHIRDKKFVISAMGRSRTLSDVQEESRKCEIRCANCHRRKTALQLHWHKKVVPL